MGNAYFKRALPIWAKGKSKELNCNCVFFGQVGCGEFDLTITANSFYRVFLNGKLVGYGPARATHYYSRVDKLKLICEREINSIFIEVSGYNCKSFYSLNTPAFLQAEILQNGEVVLSTGDNIQCSINTTRLQKVLRFSYQRPFTESYVFEKNPLDLYNDGLTEKVQVEVVDGYTLLDRNVGYPTFEYASFYPSEFGNFEIDETIEPYRDRYMTNTNLKIFELNELETNPSDFASKLKYNFKSNSLNGDLNKNEYALFESERSLTGFIKVKLKAKQDSHFIILFDEMNLENDGVLPKKLDFSRNTTVNIVEYRVKKGDFEHISFEPYTAKYIKVIVIEGCVRDLSIGIVKYENPDCDSFKLWCENEKIIKIVQAGRDTFKQNAVDVLTDCPSRERAGWLCDSFFSSQAEKLFTGKNLVEYNFLENYALLKKHNYLPKNMIAMCYPADFEDGVFIPNWSMWYMIEQLEHYKRTGDLSLAEKSKSIVYGLIDFFKGYQNEDGLLEDLPSWVFIEWSVANNAEYVCGVNYPSNMLYGYALKCVGELYDDQSLISLGEAIFDKIRKQSFNGEFFEDNRVRENGKLVLKGHISETCQYYAFFTGVADRASFAKLFETIERDFGPLRDDKKVYPNVGKSNVFVGDYLRLEIFRRYGLYENIAKESVEYFYKMAETTGTLWEHDSTIASLNHGFTSYIANLLIEYLCGFVMVDEKNKKIIIKECSCALDCDITIPMSNGESLRIIRKDKNLQINKPNNFSV